MVVGTWNLENLFRPGDDDGPGDEPAYEAKLTELARVIGTIDPDALAVQEVGDPEALDDLLDHLDGDWHSETSEFPDARGIRVGFLSRLVDVRSTRSVGMHSGLGWAYRSARTDTGRQPGSGVPIPFKLRAPLSRTGGSGVVAPGQGLLGSVPPLRAGA